MKKKKCKKCGCIKELRFFYENKGIKDGRMNKCRKCISIENTKKKQNLGNREEIEKKIDKARERVGLPAYRGKTYAEIRKEAQKRGKSKHEVEHITNQSYY